MLVRQGSIILSKTLGAKTLRYLCDFEDGWEQALTIERFADPVLSEFCVHACCKRPGVPPTPANSQADPHSSRTAK
jgi:hypothetical protein